MDDILITTKDEIRYERLLVEAKIKECGHVHMVEDFCMVCKKVVQ